MSGWQLLVATLSRQVYTMGFVEHDPLKNKVEDLRRKDPAGSEIIAETSLPSASSSTSSHSSPSASSAAASASSTKPPRASRTLWLDPVCEPAKRELLFTYVPSTAEILAIDVYCRREMKTDFVIGIAIVKHDLHQPDHYYLNIYSDWTDGANLENLAQSAYTVELDFVPTRLFHTYVPLRVPRGNVENLFLLFGQDERFRLYVEDPSQSKFVSVPTKRFFPEFGLDFGCYPTAADIAYLDPESEYRFSVVCTEKGYAYAKVERWTFQLENSFYLVILHAGCEGSRQRRGQQPPAAHRHPRVGDCDRRRHGQLGKDLSGERARSGRRQARKRTRRRRPQSVRRQH